MSSVHSADYRKFLKKFRQARMDAGLSQIDVAKALKTRQALISRCELGERRIDFIELRRFAKLYRKPLSYFEP